MREDYVLHWGCCCICKIKEDWRKSWEPVGHVCGSLSQPIEDKIKKLDGLNIESYKIPQDFLSSCITWRTFFCWFIFYKQHIFQDGHLAFCHHNTSGLCIAMQFLKGDYGQTKHSTILTSTAGFLLSRCVLLQT